MSERDDDTRRFLPAPGVAYFAPDPEAVHDQGDDLICGNCTGGDHVHCEAGAAGEWWEDGCACTEGACRGEWVDVGRLESVDGEQLHVAGRVYFAPLGTDPPTPARLEPVAPPPHFQVLEAHVTAEGMRVIDKIAPLDGPADLGAIGPQIPVYREDRPDGTYVQGSIGPAHPAYAAIRAGLTTSLSVGESPAGNLSDKNDYVALDPVRGGSPPPSPSVPVASPPVNGLGREHIARRTHVPPPAHIGLGDTVAALFGAELTGDPDEPVAEITTIRPNRADRRRAQRGRRRG